MVSGKREEETRDENDRYFAYERSYGTFSRSFVLPEGADMEHVKDPSSRTASSASWCRRRRRCSRAASKLGGSAEKSEKQAQPAPQAKKAA